MDWIEPKRLAPGMTIGIMAPASASDVDLHRIEEICKAKGYKVLVGEITLPMPVASVGGSIGINPTVKVARGLLNNPDAKTLASILVSVGLAQNLAALKALVGDGIQKGHMKLHAKSLAILAGATNDNIELIVEELRKEKHMNLASAKKIVEKYNK